MLGFRKGLGWLLLSVIAATAPAQERLVPKTCTDEDYAVFSALLNHLYPKQKGETVVLIDRTMIHPSLSGSPPNQRRSFFENVPDEARDALYERNRYHAKIDVDKIKTSSRILVLTNDEYDALFRSRDGWEEFRRRYPMSQGIVSLSLSGIDQENRHAVIYAGVTCGPACGGGSVFLLSRENGEWKVAKMVTIWES